MRFFVTGRQWGKTTHALQQMLDNPDMVMICHSAASADQVADEFGRKYRSKFRKNPPEGYRRRFMSCEVARQNRGSLWHKPVIVDNVDLVLGALLGCDPESVYGTGIVDTGGGPK
jgi:hypothetical protein